MTRDTEPQEPDLAGDGDADLRYNRLAGEKSPYLLQHATNPVDWYPWGEAAFEKARREEKPIFLSIGYSTCHWCHVMERESFEDERVAELLNDAFVPIKVDREERPDVDGVYMTVCQLMTGSGGWPLTVALTPDRKPFFAGTYFPRETRGGRIGMLDLVPRLERVWIERREEVLDSADRVVEALRRASGESGAERDGEGAGTPVAPGEAPAPEGRGSLDERVLEHAYRQLEASYDDLQGGFGRAPKFPTPHNLLLLLRWWRRSGEERALEMVEDTLRAMRRGGIFDQVGFGFHRYSTDARWLLPHFEKMLYDQALLGMAYVEAFQATGRERYGRTAREVFGYVLRDLRDPGGGFHSAEDADSEGREGKFYLWTDAELREVLGEEDAGVVKEVYGVQRRGNFAEEATGERTGENVLHLSKPLSMLAADRDLSESELRERLEKARQRLFAARERRERPLKDDKVLTDWNGLMIAALAKGARALGEDAWLEAAREAAGFLLGNLRDREGRLLHRWRQGEAAIPATADDHACLIWALIELYETDFDPRWLREALELQEMLDARYWDGEAGGYYVTAGDATDLPVRRKEIHDGAVPSANSVAYLNLLRLARLTGRTALAARADRLEAAFAPTVGRAPAAETMFLVGLDFRIGPSHEVVIAGDPETEDTQRMVEALGRGFFPRAVVVLRPSGDGGRGGAGRGSDAPSGTGEPSAEEPEIVRLAPYTRGHRPVDDRTAAYVCRDFACRAPTTSLEELLESLEAGAAERPS